MSYQNADQDSFKKGFFVVTEGVCHDRDFLPYRVNPTNKTCWNELYIVPLAMMTSVVKHQHNNETCSL